MLWLKTFQFSPHCLRDNLVCQKEGKENMGAWEVRRAREEWGRETRSSPPFSLVGGLHKRDTIRQTDGPLVPMVGLVPIEKDVIPMVLLVNMHLIKGT